jgi:polysaccharide biosynthesis/export protein
MMRSLLHLSLIATALLTSHPGVVVAQINIQQQMPLPSYSGNSSGSANRNAAMGSELRVVPEDVTKLKLAPGFLVGLNVLEDPDFYGNFRVDEQGNLVIPIIGILHVAGETSFEARNQIEKRLIDDQILKHPQVVFSVLEYAAPTVTIIGEVGSPGKYPLLAPQKLVDVLAMAGGPTLLAGNQVQITPGGSGGDPILVHYSRTADPKMIEDVFVRPGDTVQMKRAGLVYVLGAVNRPGGYVMQEDGTLNIMEAMSLANGTSNIASTKTIYVIRKNTDGSEVDMAISYKKITQGKAQDVQLHAKDILFVPTNSAKSVLVNTQPIWSSAASAAVYYGIYR